MAGELVSLMLMSSIFLGVVLIILLFVWAFKPRRHNPHRRRNSGKVNEELNKIKDQINGDEEY